MKNLAMVRMSAIITTMTHFPHEVNGYGINLEKDVWERKVRFDLKV
jgi:hypothetical protein